MATYSDGPLGNENSVSTLADPPVGGVNITPAMVSDTVDLTKPIRGIEFVASGTVTVIDGLGNTVALYSRASGTRTSMVIARIKATGTDSALKNGTLGAGNIHTAMIGLY